MKNSGWCPVGPVVLRLRPYCYNNAGSILAIKIQRVNDRAACWCSKSGTFWNFVPSDDHNNIVFHCGGYKPDVDNSWNVHNCYWLRNDSFLYDSPVYLSCSTEQGLTDTVMKPRASASMCEDQSTLSSACSHTRTSMANLLLPLHTVRGSKEVRLEQITSL